MKKIILLFAIGAFFLSAKSAEAQQFVASFGSYHNWDIPSTVYHTVYHDYRNFDIVHARRVPRAGQLYFDVILQRGDVFIEVHIGASGHVFNRVYYDYYPLNQHVCSAYCGYHANYYTVNRVVCNSHHHHGHNHVLYRNQVPRGNAYGYYKNGKGHHKHHSVNNNVYYPDRRDRYHDTRVVRGRSAHDHDNRGRSGRWENDHDDDHHKRRKGSDSRSRGRNSRGD